MYLVEFDTKRKELPFLYMIVTGLLLLTASPAFAIDFQQKYERGKLLFRQKMYFDAAKELHIAVTQTVRGKKHFGAHYYLARAYYWLPDIQKAMETLNKAKKLLKKNNKVQKMAYGNLRRIISNLYGKINFSPQVDPDEMGRMKLKLQPKSAFSHPHKRRYFRILLKKMKKQGGLVLDNKPLYVPKGEYNISLAMTQCLSYGLFQNDKVVSSLNVEEAVITLNVAGKKSCQCPGGQVPTKQAKQLVCLCPANTAWDKKKKQCTIIGKPKAVWPWVVLGVGLGVVGGGIAIITVATQSDGKIKGKAKPPPSGLW